MEGLVLQGESMSGNERVRMQEAILIVDDNRLILESLCQLLKDEEVRLLTANDDQEATALVREEEIAVILCDNIMPGMSGLDFLTCLTTISPNTIKILMSAFADLPTVLTAINRSEVFRYVLKPWHDAEMTAAVREGLRRYKLVQAMRKEDEDILNGTGQLTRQEFETMKMHSFWGADVAAKANLSQVARNIIHYHHERFDGTGYPDGLSGKDIPIEARIVAVADVYDALTNDRPYRKSYPMAEAMEIMAGMQESTFDPEISGLFFSLLGENKHIEAEEKAMKEYAPA